MVETALAALAHDIRTPLTGILAHAELLAASDLGARERGWALGIKSAADHLAQLTTIVCDAVRAGAVGLVLREEPFSPRAMAESLGESLSARAQTSGLKAEVLIARDLPQSVVGDAVRLRAAVENLIDNAIKFTARGKVALRVSAASAAAGKKRLVFSVADSGIGLKRADIGKLFRPFAQASEAVSRRYGGTGLGLTLVRRLARAMGGDLTVTSSPGRGSEFRLAVILPVADAGRGGEHAPRKRAGGKRTERARHVLCVEDSPYGRVILNTMLRELGDEADFVGSADAALERLARGHFDLVLMDITLNGVDGFEITRRIRALPKPLGTIPVIGLSARTDPDAEAHARDTGMNAYLTKPVSPTALARAMDEAAPRTAS